MFMMMATNPMVCGLSALYAGTFFSGAWAMIMPTIPVLARQFDVLAGGAAPLLGGYLANSLNPGASFFAYAPLLLLSALLLTLVGKETLECRECFAITLPLTIFD